MCLWVFVLGSGLLGVFAIAARSALAIECRFTAQRRQSRPLCHGPPRGGGLSLYTCGAAALEVRVHCGSSSDPLR